MGTVPIVSSKESSSLLQSRVEFRRAADLVLVRVALGDASHQPERPEGVEAQAAVCTDLFAVLCFRHLADALQEVALRRAVGIDIKELRPDLHLYIIGDGPDREALRLKAREMEIDRRMTFLGNQPNPYAYMSHMDGLALTSRYEGQGMVIMEAKALGLDLYVSRNLEGCNQGIRCSDDIAAELLTADKKVKVRDDLSAYNRNISRQLDRIFGIRRD